MIKVRDGYAKLINTSYTGDISLVLLSNGGTIGYDVSTNTILATIGSNVASADKLKNKVKIWGLDFDGSSDVAGDLLLGANKILGKDAADIVNAGSNHLVLGYGSSEKGWPTYVDGDSIYLRYGTSHSDGIFVNSSGKVGIGTTSPTLKLHVAGAGIFYNTSSTTFTTNGITIGAGDAAERYITCYGKTGSSYINVGYGPGTNNSGEFFFNYVSSGSTSNYSGVGIYGGANYMYLYPDYATFRKPLIMPGELYSGNYAINMSNSDIVGINALYTADNAEGGTEGLQFSRGNGYYDSVWASGGVLYFSPNGNLNRAGSYSTNYTVLHTGNYSSYLNGTYLRKVTVANNTTNDFNTFENMTLTGRGDPVSGASLSNAPWTGSGPAGGYGVLTYLWSGYGTQMAWGYNSNRIYIRNKYYTNSTSTWSSTWQSLALVGESYTKSEADSRFVNVTGDTMTGNLTVPSLNSYYLFRTTDIAEGAANLGTLATAHTITFFRNGIMIPYKMDNANDGGMIRTKGASEDSCVFEMATWDDSGAGETIQLNYYSTTSQLTPTYSNIVPKVSGTLLNSGNWPSYIGGHGYVMREYTIDATGLDLNTWYPVTMTIGACPNVRIEVRVSLNSGSKPSWSTHGSGFAVRKIWEVNGSGWGTNPVHRTVFVSDYAHASADPVRGMGDMGYSSTEYVYVRGGGRYYFYTSHNITPYLRTSTYVGTADPYYLAISPTTTAPGTIAGFLINRSMYASHFYENSDIKLKENINLISSSDNIPLLKEFNWKSDGKHSYGLIAQELEAMGYSELVEESGDHKTVNYSAALSLIVGKLQVKIKELEKEIEILKNKN